MQEEAENGAEKPHTGTTDGSADAGHLIALRSELARKIAAHIQVEGDQITLVPSLVLFRRTAQTLFGHLRALDHRLRAGPEACRHRRRDVCVR